MGRVTFSGPVKSNGGFEIGQSGSDSSYAGTTILTGTGSAITLYAPTASFTTCVISGAIDIAGTWTMNTCNMTTVTISSSLALPSSTAGTITIGGAVTGWNNPVTVLGSVTLGPGAANAATMNCNANSKFYIYTTSTGSIIVTPVGGYAGQYVTVYWSCGTSTGIAFASSSSLAMRYAGASGVTAWAGFTGSLCSITFVNMGPNLIAGASAASLLLETTRVNDHGILL
jgi:hypothetical protein